MKQKFSGNRKELSAFITFYDRPTLKLNSVKFKTIEAYQSYLKILFPKARDIRVEYANENEKEKAE